MVAQLLHCLHQAIRHSGNCEEEKAMRRVLLTGANRGIGLEFARQLLDAGDRVIATCRHPGQASVLNALVASHPNRLHILPLDVASEPSSSDERRVGNRVVSKVRSGRATYN